MHVPRQRALQSTPQEIWYDHLTPLTPPLPSLPSPLSPSNPNLFLGRRVGRILAKKGVRGHFGVDFLTTTTPPQDAEKATNEHDGYYVFALEINLRQCGTTHPYFTMKFLTGMQ